MKVKAVVETFLDEREKVSSYHSGARFYRDAHSSLAARKPKTSGRVFVCLFVCARAHGQGACEDTSDWHLVDIDLSLKVTHRGVEDNNLCMRDRQSYDMLLAQPLMLLTMTFS